MLFTLTCVNAKGFSSLNDSLAIVSVDRIIRIRSRVPDSCRERYIST